MAMQMAIFTAVGSEHIKLNSKYTEIKYHKFGNLWKFQHLNNARTSK